MANDQDERACENTDRELWRETQGDYYAPSLFVTKGGGIGINVGGSVYVMPVREWHQLACGEHEKVLSFASDERRRLAVEALEAARDLLIGCQKQLGFLPEQNGYSTTLSPLERQIANGIASINEILRQQAEEEGHGYTL